MTNKEKHVDVLVKAAFSGSGLCFDKHGNFKSCSYIDCKECKFFVSGCNYNQYSENEIIEWLNQEYEEPKIDPRLYDAPVDTKILVSSDGKKWAKRYLCKIEGDRASAFNLGTTSYSCGDEVPVTYNWDYAKLWEGDNDGKTDCGNDSGTDCE